MAKKRFRGQVGGLTPKGERITIGYVTSNGGSVSNARDKGCFGFNDPYARHGKAYRKRHKV